MSLEWTRRPTSLSMYFSWMQLMTTYHRVVAAASIPSAVAQRSSIVAVPDWCNACDVRNEKFIRSEKKKNAQVWRSIAYPTIRCPASPSDATLFDGVKPICGLHWFWPPLLRFICSKSRGLRTSGGSLTPLRRFAGNMYVGGYIGSRYLTLIVRKRRD